MLPAEGQRSADGNSDVDGLMRESWRGWIDEVIMTAHVLYNTGQS